MLKATSMFILLAALLVGCGGSDGISPGDAYNAYQTAESLQRTAAPIQTSAAEMAATALTGGNAYRETAQSLAQTTGAQAQPLIETARARIPQLP